MSPDDIELRGDLTQVRGPAGTGKTSAAIGFANLPDAVALAATGKAVAVLRRKGAQRAETIHSALYGKPKVRANADGTETLDWVPHRTPIEAELLVIDETSLIGPKEGRRLLELGIPAITFGDSFQLPPVRSRAFFDQLPIDYQLTESHRQARGSPVLRLARRIREGGQLPQGDYFDEDIIAGSDVVLCALNNTKHRINRIIRRKRFGIRQGPPVVGETVICLRNNHALDIQNGSTWTIERVRMRGDLLELRLSDPDAGERTIRTPYETFGAEYPELHQLPRDISPMDFGYAMTVHKAQGSEWGNVAILDETRTNNFRWVAECSGMKLEEYQRRWMYTGVTRASREITIMD